MTAPASQPADNVVSLRGRPPATREAVPAIPRRKWAELQPEVSAMWQPKDAPHHSIIGLTGSGKSYFTRHAIMPMIAMDKVLIIDCKGGDPTWIGSAGKPVREIPPHWHMELNRRRKQRTPRDNWVHLVTHDDFGEARAQVRKALKRVWAEEGWFVVVDECRALTDPQAPGLRLRSEIEQLWLRGRSKQISVIAMTQSPRWVPGSFYDQPSFVWIGRVNDEDAQKRLREIGGLSKEHLPLLRALPKRQFLMVAEGGDRMAITGL